MIFPFPDHYVLFQIVWHGGMCDIWQWRNFGALLLVVNFWNFFVMAGLWPVTTNQFQCCQEGPVMTSEVTNTVFNSHSFIWF